MSLLREDWLSSLSKHSHFKERKSKLCRSCCPCLLPPCQLPNKICSWEVLSQEDICCLCDCSSRPSPLGSDFFINVCCLCLMSRKCLDFLRLCAMSWKCCCVPACMCPSLKSALWGKHLRIKCWFIKKKYFMLKKPRALDAALDSFWLTRHVKILLIRVVLLKSVISLPAEGRKGLPTLREWKSKTGAL